MSDSTWDIRRGMLVVGQWAAQIIILVSVLAALGLFLLSQSESNSTSPEATASQPGQSEGPNLAVPPAPLQHPTAVASATAIAMATAVPHPSPTPTVTRTPPPPTPYVPKIGIVVGHWWLGDYGQQSLDVGGVCDEGMPSELHELDINLEVAQRVVFELKRAGYNAEMLQEWDERLTGYQADVMLSIHADACLYPEASGFKVARVADSQVPEIEDRLVACLIESYRGRTGLAFHAGSITPDMTQYHTFYEIDGFTPGAIIETGFMLADRALLTQRPDLVAQGIIDGILCYLDGEGMALE